MAAAEVAYNAGITLWRGKAFGDHGISLSSGLTWEQLVHGGYFKVCLDKHAVPILCVTAEDHAKIAEIINPQFRQLPGREFRAFLASLT